jgi:FkbM family methyltransferase
MNANLNYLTSKWKALQKHKTFKESPIKAISRVAIWGIHCIFKRPATIKLLPSETLFYLPPKFKQGGSTGVYVLREDIEPELNYLKEVLSPGSVFVDAGANVGIYTVIASKLVGETGKVLAFEPAAETYPTLDRNVEINKMANVKVFHAAISDKPGTARFYHVNNAPNSYSLGADGEKTAFEEVSVVTLEDVFRSEGINRFDLMKIDVEGAEELVLRGGKSLITQMRPEIIFEMTADKPQKLGLEQDGAWKLLQEWGYEFLVVEQNGSLTPITSPQIGNVLAIPREKRAKDN